MVGPSPMKGPPLDPLTTLKVGRCSHFGEYMASNGAEPEAPRDDWDCSRDGGDQAVGRTYQTGLVVVVVAAELPIIVDAGWEACWHNEPDHLDATTW